MKQYSRVWAEIDLDAVRDNLLAMRKHLLPGMKLCAVVKTDGYGHGAVPVAKEVEDLVWGYAVATYQEALNLRHHHIKKPVLILGYTEEASCREMARLEIRPTVFSLKLAERLSAEWKEYAEDCGKRGEKAKPLKIHIAVDTGMGRLGFLAQEDGEFQKSILEIEKISRMEGLEAEGMFTHFARADEKDPSAARLQAGRFQRVSQALADRGVEIPVQHCSNSAGIVMLKGVGFSMARAGITMYGLYPSEEVDGSEMKFRPALSLYSKVIFVKEVPAGTTVSYGWTYVTDKKTRIATVPAGYGDGYPRSLSNRGYVLIRGKKAPVIGRVCMDQMMVDVTEIPEAEEGDVATLIGRDGEEELPVERLSALSGKFNYEFVCGISKRVPRVYLRGGKAAGVKDYGIDEYADFF